MTAARSLTERPVLFVASYAEPDPVGSNRGAAAQAMALRAAGVPVEILTWPLDPTWRGPVARRETGVLAGQPYLRTVREGIPYHVIAPPRLWSERVPTEGEWETAVAWGVEVLRALAPRLLHQHYWQNSWWMMEAAGRLGIPVVYTAYDYGIGCLRTVLVTGAGTLCDGVAAVEKCGACILAGRNALGRINEAVAALPGAEPVLTRLLGDDFQGPLGRVSGVRMPVRRRVGLTLERCRRVLGPVDAAVVTSPFAKTFLSQFGVPAERTHVLPWFHAHDTLLPDPPPVGEVLRLGYVGRISPEKGVHVLLEALERTRSAVPIELHLAGSHDSEYVRDLARRYPERAGPHRVRWAGWVANDRLPEFYADLHAVVIPSLWYDNTPFAMVEALAQGRPVVCTDVPSMTHLVEHGTNGLTFPMGDVAALSDRLAQLAADPGFVAVLARATRNVPSLDRYRAALQEIYEDVLAARGAGALRAVG